VHFPFPLPSLCCRPIFLRVETDNIIRQTTLAPVLASRFPSLSSKNKPPYIVLIVMMRFAPAANMLALARHARTTTRLSSSAWRLMSTAAPSVKVSELRTALISMLCILLLFNAEGKDPSDIMVSSLSTTIRKLLIENSFLNTFHFLFANFYQKSTLLPPKY
jgi:hypothetical protein